MSRAPRDYRSVGVIFDRARKPYGRNHRVWDLTVGLWWFDVAVRSHE